MAPIYLAKIEGKKRESIGITSGRTLPITPPISHRDTWVFWGLLEPMKAIIALSFGI
jgi:hypothetical protein